MTLNKQFKEAKKVLYSFGDKDDWKISQARKLFSSMEKECDSIPEIIQSPYYQNVVNILGPYAIYYKIDQVLKLLKELQSQSRTPEVTKSPFYAKPLVT